ncbi:DUF3891 family protein [Negadavirga shengliensis]|uniref:DUF3891 family protein n=1 Tax=Negadavirga shengliensis TaxID=1389218 RepID=A0ABV9SYM6_9BACT
MIVNDLESHFEIIFQRAHGLMAANLAHHLKPSVWPRDKFWLETLVAIADHDDGRMGWSGNFHINGKGYPKSYKEFAFDSDQVVRISHTAACKSTWIALLISKHLEELYKNVDQINARKFIAEQKDRQKKFLRRLSIGEKEAENYYRILKWSDELSLTICQNALPSDGTKKLLETVMNRKRSYLSKSNGKYVLEPWVFEGPSLTVGVEYRNIPHRRYENDDDLHTALDQVPVNIKSVCLQKPEKQP